MPNYAYTSHHISGDAKEIQAFCDVLCRVRNHPEGPQRDSEYYGRMSFRHFLEGLCGEVPPIDLRGQICDFGIEGDCVIQMFTESAWSIPLEIHDLIRQQFPSFRILYFMDPDDEGVMATNDVDGEVFTTRYGIATEDEDEEFFDTVEEACQWANLHLGVAANTLEELRDALLDYEEEHGMFVSLHECIMDEQLLC